MMDSEHLVSSPYAARVWERVLGRARTAGYPWDLM